MKKCCQKYHTSKAENCKIIWIRRIKQLYFICSMLFSGDSQDAYCIYYDLNDAERDWYIQRYCLELSPN